jgi:hypothetical protein
MAYNVSVVHDVPEPGEARRRHVRALPIRYPFTACAASARQRALREMTCYLKFELTVAKQSRRVTATWPPSPSIQGFARAP